MFFNFFNLKTRGYNKLSPRLTFNLNIPLGLIIGCNKTFILSFPIQIWQLRIESLFPNTVIILKIFCCIPLTIARSERALKVRGQVKNMYRSTILQDQLNYLEILSIKSNLVRKFYFSKIVQEFANRKTRRLID